MDFFNVMGIQMLNIILYFNSFSNLIEDRISETYTNATQKHSKCKKNISSNFTNPV